MNYTKQSFPELFKITTTSKAVIWTEICNQLGNSEKENPHL